MLEGVACLPGVDTLLLLLLADLGDARQVAAFAAVPNGVDVPSVEPRLRVCGKGGVVSRACSWTLLLLLPPVLPRSLVCGFKHTIHS